MLFERHQTEGGFQASLYLKITMFRWVNTAIVLQWITPFTKTLGITRTDLLPSVSAILWAECWITPAIRILDIASNFQKHILAPRAYTQEQMNMFFLGTRYNLGERYTDLTKVLFVCFFYSALFPASFFFGFVVSYSIHIHGNNGASTVATAIHTLTPQTQTYKTTTDIVRSILDRQVLPLASLGMESNARITACHLQSSILFHGGSGCLCDIVFLCMGAIFLRQCVRSGERYRYSNVHYHRERQNSGAITIDHYYSGTRRASILLCTRLPKTTRGLLPSQCGRSAKWFKVDERRSGDSSDPLLLVDTHWGDFFFGRCFLCHRIQGFGGLVQEHL